MADYWISQPRKHCDFCDCWIADNKPSIDFHERGKRHKENVEKKIAELRKKGQQQHKEQQELAGSLQRIEEEALKKFQQDVANDPVLSAKYKALQKAKSAAAIDTPNTASAGTNKAENSKTQQDAGVDRIQPDTPSQENTQQNQPLWYEGTTEEGQVYYWNSVTQESQWVEPPDFDGVSVSSYQQQDTKSTETKTDTTTESSENKEEEEEKEEMEEEEEETESIELTDRISGKRKANTAAYGTWTTVETVEPVDLQLPGERKVFQQYIPRVAEKKPKDRLKFKEKTVTSLAGGNSSTDTQVGFKKRKFGGNVRKRDKDA